MYWRKRSGKSFPALKLLKELKRIKTNFNLTLEY
jgi:hypothetical protein